MRTTSIERPERDILLDQEIIRRPRLLVFCDRDDTVSHDPGWLGKDDDWKEQTYLHANTIVFINYLQERYDVTLVMVSNQAGVGLNYFDTDRVDAINRHIDTLLAAQGIHPALWIYEPNIDPEYIKNKNEEREKAGKAPLHIALHEAKTSLATRKPYASMAYQALYELGKMPEDFDGAIMLGDRSDDAGFAESLGDNIQYLQVIDDNITKHRTDPAELISRFDHYHHVTPILSWIA